VPPIVGSGHAQVEHGFRIGFFPPAAGDLEALLHNVTVAAFDFSRANGVIFRRRVFIVQVLAPLLEVTIRRAHGSLLGIGGFLMIEEAAQYFTYLIVQQSTLLPAHPATLLAFAAKFLRRCGQIFAHVIEINDKRP
jgi:hypothetical protein